MENTDLINLVVYYILKKKVSSIVIHKGEEKDDFYKFKMTYWTNGEYTLTVSDSEGNYNIWNSQIETVNYNSENRILEVYINE